MTDADQAEDAGPQRQLTKGERRVRTRFNPGELSVVASIKQKGAALIDEVDQLDHPEFGKRALSEEEMGEFRRLKATAQTMIEDGTMWAVKAATS